MVAAVCMAGTGWTAETNTLADRLLAQSGRIRTMRCEIRREVETGGQSMVNLSRVWFSRPDRLRVEMVSPEARRIVADGQEIHKWIVGQTRGVRIPINEAGEGDLIQLRRTPGTADEQLMRVRAYPEVVLPPLEGFAERRAYTPPAPHPYTVLSLDATGRLARLEFFDSEAATNRLLKVEYGGWKEVQPGIWVSTLQKTEAKGRDGTQVAETLRVSNLAVNEPLDPGEFDAAVHGKGVRFLSPGEAAEFLK